MKKAKRLTTLFCLSLILGGAGCSSPHPPEIESKEESEKDVIEPVKMDEVVTDEKTNYNFVKNLPELSEESTPKVFNGYFICLDKNNKIRILDKDGVEAGRDQYEQAIFTEDDAWFKNSRGYTYSFGYAINKEIENKIQGLKKDKGILYAYNKDSGDIVMTKEMNCNPIKWERPDTKDIKGLYKVFSLADLESNTESSEYYLWNSETNIVYGPYKVESDQGFSTEGMHDHYEVIEGIYPVKEKDGYKIINKKKVTEKTYSKAILIDSNAIYCENGQKYLMENNLDEIVLLPEEAKLSTRKNGEEILILTENGWDLYTSSKDS